MTRLLILTALLSSGCAAGVSASPLPDDAEARMTQVHLDTLADGELIYRGLVRARGGGEDVLFNYERWVQETDLGATATHLTFTPDGALVVAQQTTSAADGSLSSFEELHDQIGQWGNVEVQGDGSLLVDTLTQDLSQQVIEGPGDPVVAGPTLFGFVLDRWEPLLEGEGLRVRFPVLDEARTYSFNLELDAVDQDTVTVAMRATSPVVRLFVPEGLIVFDRQTRSVISYAGLVPPLVEDAGLLSKLDAQVTYTFVADTYK